MEFSNLFKQKNKIGCISPDGKYVAISIDERIVVRKLDTMKIVTIFETPYVYKPEISDIQWSQDSLCLLSANYKESKVHVWQLEQNGFGANEAFLSNESSKDYICGLTDEVRGIVLAKWSPIGNCIITWSEFKLRMTFWNIINQTQKYIENPKHIHKGYSFHPSGEFMALLLRNENRDQVGIFSTESWKCLKVFSVGTLDSQEIGWSPDGNAICITDTTGNYHVEIYNSVGILKRDIGIPENELGVQCFCWSPSGQFIALGGYDQGVRILNSLTWDSVAEFTTKGNALSLGIELLTDTGLIFGHNESYTGYSGEIGLIKFESKTSCLHLSKIVSSDLTKTQLRAGVSRLAFNADGTLLMIINENTPNCIWIWSMIRMRIQTIIQAKASVKMAKWSPVESEVLVFVCGNASVYIYKHDQGDIESSIRGFELRPKENLNFTKLSWNPTGESVLLFDSNVFTIGNIV